MTETIGFIGLGVLGSAMAGNLVKCGFAVIGHDSAPEKMAALEGEGGQSAVSPKDVADRSDVIILCLPTADALRDVVGGKDGLKDGGGEGQIILEVSTFAIADKEKARDVLAAAGKILLDCPVSGNRILALKRQLTAFGSGDKAAYEAVEHIIAGFAHRAFYVGDFGCGMKMKFCGNILNLVHNSVAAEVMVLGMKAGLDPEMIHKAISGSGSSSSMFEVRGALMVNEEYDKEGMNFSIPLKDSRLISAHAADHLCPIPIYQAALQPYYAAVAQGHHDEDASAVCAALERAANYTRPKNKKKF
ncbi:MAG: NAD(P)-dependent oxidoreductase [Proteobacteria bacterium]|nr:NAD(P)-dependent oxidoreductase [Pseudomonadota bacterium]